MYPCYMEYEVANRRQALLHEAEVERSIPEVPAQQFDLSDKQSLVLTVALAAFGLGLFAGGWLNSVVHLDIILLFGCIVALAACVSVARHTFFLLRRRRIKLLLHHQ
jgi:hypothetical protein